MEINKWIKNKFWSEQSNFTRWGKDFVTKWILQVVGYNILAVFKVNTLLSLKVFVEDILKTRKHSRQQIQNQNYIIQDYILGI